jgi:hypothetical protein
LIHSVNASPSVIEMRATRGIVECHERLALPVLLAHGQHGSFTDFEAYGHVAAHAQAQWKRRVFAAGSMPHLERAADFDAAYQSWAGGHVLPARGRVVSKRFADEGISNRIQHANETSAAAPA